MGTLLRWFAWLLPRLLLWLDPKGVVHHYHLNDVASDTKTKLNTGHYIRLYKDITGDETADPGSDLVYSDFTEANFTGYAAQSLDSDFTGPTEPSVGYEQIVSGTHTFTCTGGSSQDVYGVYITKSNTDVRFSKRFPAKITFANGVQVSITVTPQDISFSVL